MSLRMEKLLKLLVMSSYLWMFLLIFIKPAKMSLYILKPYRYENHERCRENYPIKFTKNFTTAPGMVDQSTIISRCINGGRDMELTWRKPERSHLVEYYVVEMNPRVYNYYTTPCLRSKSSEPIIIFNATTRKDEYFVNGVNFYIRIQTYPLSPDIDSAEFKNVGGCPTSGTWSTWGIWSSCTCNEFYCDEESHPNCLGHKYRSRTCDYTHNPKVKSWEVNCRDDGYMGESKDSYTRNICARKCAPNESLGDNNTEKSIFTTPRSRRNGGL